ncbi:MAG: SGNH/GDSL hydrolase family protein [Acidimicrobiales bacterium]
MKPVNGKVTVLEIGDSLGLDLGFGLQWALSNDPHVNLVQDARGYTGLANTAYYNWPAQIQVDLNATHPQIVVVFLGANDVQNFYQNNQYITVGTPQWRQAYGARVAKMMTEATAAGAKVLWVGMPIMQQAHFSSEMAKVNSVFEAQAASHPGVTYFSSWKLFATPSGQFNGGSTNVAGSPMPLRDPDGIHLADGGGDLLATAIVHEMKAIYQLP